MRNGNIWRARIFTNMTVCLYKFDYWQTNRIILVRFVSIRARVYAIFSPAPSHRAIIKTWCACLLDASRYPFQIGNTTWHTIHLYRMLLVDVFVCAFCVADWRNYFRVCVCALVPVKFCQQILRFTSSHACVLMHIFMIDWSSIVMGRKTLTFHLTCFINTCAF